MTLANGLVLQASKALLPRVLPAPIQSGFNRKAKSHDKTTKRGMLGVEIAEQAADKAEKERAREPPKEVEEELIPNTPERPSTPVQRKRTHTLVERTPGKLPTPGRPAPGPALGPSRLPSPEASPTAPSAPPPSTAPARLTRVGREKKMTKKMKEARERGWLPESRPR
jgi:hypothetical protein